MVSKGLVTFIIALSLILGVRISNSFSAESKKETKSEEIAGGKININTASLKELTRLKRVGTKYAERIIKYREKNGAFEKPEDIIKVKGIGRKTFEANKGMITTQ
ncbi:MAG: helix-hairpin-helix domain-containing protein [Deltaproteobacteria bacterium]|nr:helix-hairpin-helix domain-containing protein [Deltaproteobacteria bacterium]MCZ6622883.1 helix-hairpin-helix domain-containing protein [Deltaproteobacteria bacterium]